MNKNKLVSIIVPVYNVEDYIEKCIQSLINQTYKNIEIIIVNDGSPDNSISKIKKLMKKDNRIVLVNQLNSGVSVARNNGMNVAKGEYIVFVDGDDYLANDYIEYMINLINLDDVNFAFSTMNFKSKNESQTKKEYRKVVSSNEACGLLLSPDVTVGCWNKIYKKDFLDKNKMSFNANLYYGEGLQFIIDAALNAEKVSVGNRKVYYYRKNNETSATTKFSIDKIYNGEKSLKLIENKVNLNDKFVKAMLVLHFSTFYLAAIVRMIDNKCVKEFKKDFMNWKKYIFDNLLFIINNKYVSNYRKCLILAGCLFPSVISFLDKYRRKKIKKNSVE